MKKYFEWIKHVWFGPACGFAWLFFMSPVAVRLVAEFTVLNVGLVIAMFWLLPVAVMGYVYLDGEEL